MLFTLSCIFWSLVWVRRQSYSGFYRLYLFFLSLVLRILGAKPASRAKHLIGLCCLRPWGLSDGEFLRRCKQGTLQYVVIKIVCACLTVVLANAGAYGEGELNWFKGWPYVTFISNYSQVQAYIICCDVFNGFSSSSRPLYTLVFQFRRKPVRNLWFPPTWAGVGHVLFGPLLSGNTNAHTDHVCFLTGLCLCF